MLKLILTLSFVFTCQNSFSINELILNSSSNKDVVKSIKEPLENINKTEDLLTNSYLEGLYFNSTFRPDNSTTYTFSIDQITNVSDNIYKNSYIGAFYCTGQVPGNSGNTIMIPSGITAGFTFYDNLGSIEVEVQNLAEAYSNEVRQSESQRALSFVDAFTGVITVHYSIFFTDNTVEVERPFVTTLSPVVLSPINFWLFDETISDTTPLTDINSTFESPTVGILAYESCLVGYPFDNTSPSWRKASMERRNSPTQINYIPEANYNIPFETSQMTGILIKQPFQNNGLENKLVFNVSSVGYTDLQFAFAAANELAAEGLILEYSVVEGNPSWSTLNMYSSQLILSNYYKKFMADLSSVSEADNNANLKIRIRFTGSNLTADAGNRVSFNNFSLSGQPLILNLMENQLLDFIVFPNPTSDVINIAHTYAEVHFNLYSVEGKVIQSGLLDSSRINIENLPKGLYLLQLSAEGKTETKKIIKK